MAQITKRPIPVLLGNDYEHAMGEATIEEENDRVTISIVAEGEGAMVLAAVLTAAEPMALSFVAIPVQPHRTHIKENT